MQNDWAYLEKYAIENQQLLKLPNNGNRIVFIGDSITEFWQRYDSVFFTQNKYINRGISSQTTSQIQERFQNDVIDLYRALAVNFKICSLEILNMWADKKAYSLAQGQ